MKEKILDFHPELANDELELSCGNCWGHQEYKDEYVEKPKDVTRNIGDNFISRFVKKYIRKGRK